MKSLSSSDRQRTAGLDRLFGGFNCSDSPGLVVGIRACETIIYRRGFGLASVQHGIANAPQTRVRIASITKQFTCLALMLLAEEQKVDIDASVSNYLPELQEPLGRATLRQLMTHSSGFRCTLEMGTIANGSAIQPREWQWQALQRQTTTQFLPGEAQLYCNGAYTALTDVIERYSGHRFADFLRQRIFEPLAMYDTEVVTDDTIMVPGMASAHVRTNRGWKRPPADTELRGDGGIVSTIDDLLRWLSHVRGPKHVGSSATWAELLEPLQLNSGFKTTYAMGIKRHSYRGTEVIQHSGGLFGLNAQIVTVPAHGIDVAIVVNGAAASATRLAFAAIDIVLADALAEPASTKARTTEFNCLLARHFALPSGLLLSFADMEGTLGLSQMNMLPAPVLCSDKSTLFVTFEEIGFGPLVWSKADLATFRKNPEGGLRVTIAGKAHQLETLAPITGFAAEVLRKAGGSYFSDELAARAAVMFDDDGGLLRMKGDYSAERAFSLHALSQRHLGLVSLDGDERYAIEIVPGEDGRASGFWVDTHRARRIRFDRVEEDRL